MTLEVLNSLDRDAFVESAGWVFEHSAWVAERAWYSRPFRNIGALHQAMVEQVEQALPEEQIALLQAHPDLGTRARVSRTSASEQAGAGLDQLTPKEFALFERLNAAWRKKFGFPFLFAVRGSTKRDILRAMEQRLASPYRDEYAEALRQVYRIAQFRLDDHLRQEN